MSIVVPMLKSSQGEAASQGPSAPPPDQVFALMAATQMHSEGRLLAQDDPQHDPESTDILQRYNDRKKNQFNPTPPQNNWPSTGQRDRPAMNT
jgi:hypothetical protein